MIGNNPVDDMAALAVGLEGFLVTDYLENPNNTPLDTYKKGTFQELEACLAALPAVEG